MTLSKEAIKLLTELGHEPHEHVFELEDGTLFSVNNEGKASQIHRKAEGLANDEIIVHTLTGLVDYIKSKLERTDEKFLLHIENNQTVKLKGLLQSDGSRENLIRAEALTPNFKFDTFYPSEDFLIALNARFTDDHDREKIISFAGNVKEDDVRQTSDDGFSQKTTVKRGISRVGEEIVPNPVTLAPYRTFTEVAQPESEFVFRMKEGPLFALFEADGGAWRNKAIFNIQTFLEDELKEDIEENRITILA